MNREDGTISIEKVGTSYRAYFEYDKDFISWVKKDGHGSWNSAGRYWSLTAKGVLNLLDQHNDKWFNVADDTMEAAKAEIEAEQAEAEHRRQKIEDAQRREADYWATPAEQRLAGIKPIERYDFKSTPYPHQIEAFNYILKREKILVADEPGLGKTAESIYASDYIKKAGKAKKCLIVCGVNTIKYNWLDEIQKHSDQKAILIDGTEKKRCMDRFFGTFSVFGTKLVCYTNIDSGAHADQDSGK